MARTLTPTLVVDAVTADLALLRKRDPVLANSALAALALAMAHEVDHSENSATSKSMCSRVLFDTLARLSELTPEEDGKDSVDELTVRRANRLGRVATS